jgi:glycosyltransferase involved in cell wall biosynthesis
VCGFIKKLVATCDDWLELRTKRFYDAILPITHTLKNRLPADIQTRCTVLHGGADTDGLIVYSKQEARQRLGLNPEDIIVGLCNLCAEDHADNLPFLQGFNKAAVRHPDLKLLVSGQKKYLETQLKAFINGTHLIDVGWQPYEKYNLYLSACDLFALPFPDTPRNAGRWPNKIGDFFQLKRKVITCPTGDLKKLFEDNGALGLCVDNSEEAYVGALETVHDAISSGRPVEIPSNASGVLTMKQREQAVLGVYLSLTEKQGENTEKN